MTPAFEGFTTYAAENNPFTFKTEGSFGEALAHSFKVSQPDNLRALLFGQEGSVIDTFGGEWEFDRYTAILHKERGADNGVTIRYLGEDGLLHMLPERIITDGANVPACYLPTTVVDGAVTSYIQVRVANGIIYPPLESGGDTPSTDEPVEDEPTNPDTEEVS